MGDGGRAIGVRRLWARCLSVATAEPDLVVVTPDLLGAIGYRSGRRRGACVGTCRLTAAGGVSLLRASSPGISRAVPDPR